MASPCSLSPRPPSAALTPPSPPAVLSLPGSLPSQPSHTPPASQALVPTQPHGRLPRLLHVSLVGCSRTVTTTESRASSAPRLAVESPSQSAAPDRANGAVSVPLQPGSPGGAGTRLPLCPQGLEQGPVQRRPQRMGGFLATSFPVVVSAFPGSLAGVYRQSVFGKASWAPYPPGPSHLAVRACFLALRP